MKLGLSRSIRWQIQAWHGVLLFLTTTVLLFFFWGYERQQQLARVDDQLQSALVRALPATQFHRGPGGGPEREDPGPPGRRAGDSVFDEPQERRGRSPPRPPDSRERPEVLQARSYLQELTTTGIYVVSLTEGKQENFRTVNAPDAVSFPEPSEGTGTGQFRMRDGFRELVHFRPRGEVLIVGTSVVEVRNGLQRLAYSLGGLGVAVVGVGLLGGWWFASRAIRPLA